MRYDSAGAVPHHLHDGNGSGLGDRAHGRGQRASGPRHRSVEMLYNGTRFTRRAGAGESLRRATNLNARRASAGDSWVACNRWLGGAWSIPKGDRAFWKQAIEWNNRFQPPTLKFQARANHTCSAFDCCRAQHRLQSQSYLAIAPSGAISS